MSNLEITKEITLDFDQAVTKVTEALKEQGFGILSDLDFDKILKTKLNVDMERYKVLGACNPPLANKALGVDRRLGALLPCNVYIRDLGDGKVKVAAINPDKMFEVVDTAGLEDIVKEARERLEKAINSL